MSTCVYLESIVLSCKIHTYRVIVASLRVYSVNVELATNLMSLIIVVYVRWVYAVDYLLATKCRKVICFLHLLHIRNRTFFHVDMLVVSTVAASCFSNIARRHCPGARFRCIKHVAPPDGLMRRLWLDLTDWTCADSPPSMFLSWLSARALSIVF